MFDKKGNRTIHVVDDERSDRAPMCRLLDEDGYTVLAAADYWQAVAAQQQYQGQIDLPLTAIALPGNKGYELAKTLLRGDPNLKVLFASSPTGAEISRFYNMPVAGPHLLDKPVQAVDLLCRVETAIRSRTVRRKPKVLGSARGFDTRRSRKSR
jgi:DNA-binding response OmpR family regulator